ncbi:hypothetical protein ABVT39_002238 [Epinephelus coioides]
MDNRTNNRQRPAGDAAGRRRPPQHHHHQPNNASWGDLVEEDTRKLFHIIKKKKDQIKRLEELLEARDNGFSSEFKKSAERICELEKQNYDLTLSLQHQEKNSKQQFEEMVAKYEAEKQTASNHIKQVLRQEVESQVRREYQQKEAQLEKQIHQMGAELQKMREEQHSLLLTMSDAHTAMTTKDAALQQSQEAWQAKYDALSETMEENTKRCETQVNEFTIKASLMEEQIHQRDLEILRLTKDNNCLTNKLTETAQELTSRADEVLQSQRAWEEKLQTVKDSLYKQAEEHQQSWESQQTQVRVKVEAEIQQRDAEILRLTEDNNGLLKKLLEKTEELSRKDDEVLQSQRAWEDKCNTLETNITEELAEKHQAEVKQLMDEKVELEDLCLYVNKRRRRFLLFPRRSSDDRETQLQKMKNKMQQKAAKARGAEKMEEEMEAADCSAQAGHQ